MSYFVLLNPVNQENFVLTRVNGVVRFCLQQQVVSFADQLFLLEQVGNGLNASGVKRGVQYRVRWLETQQYLRNEYGTSCFTLTSDISQASVWEDRLGTNKEWSVTNVVNGTALGQLASSDSQTTIVQVSIFEAEQCSGACEDGEQCNYYTGECATCASCSGSCNGPCPKGFTCSLINNAYECTQQSKTLLYVGILLGILAFIALVVIIAIFATR